METGDAAPSRSQIETAIETDARNHLKRGESYAPRQDGVFAEVLRDFGLVTDARWETPRGKSAREAMDALRWARNEETAVLTDSTTIVSSASISLTPRAFIPGALSLLDLGSLLNAVVFYDRILYLATNDAGDDGISNVTRACRTFNELLADDAFVPILVPGRSTDDQGVNLAFHQLFDRAHAELSRMFSSATRRVSNMPNVSPLELQTVLSSWARLATDDQDAVSPRDVFDRNVPEHGWRSGDSGYCRWLLNRMEDTKGELRFRGGSGWDDFRSGRSMAECATEVHLRALFNAKLAFDIVDVPYRANTLRQPWMTLLTPRISAVSRILAVEEQFESIVRHRRTMYQKPPWAVLTLPSALSLALLQAETPLDLWWHTGELRRSMKGFRGRLGDLAKALTAGDGQPEQRRALELSAALTDAIPQPVMQIAPYAADTVVRAAPKLAMAPTAASAVEGLGILAGALKASGFFERLIRRLARPHLHIASELSKDAGACLSGMDHVQRLWSINDTTMDRLARRLERVASTL